MRGSTINEDDDDLFVNSRTTTEIAGGGLGSSFGAAESALRALNTAVSLSGALAMASGSEASASCSPSDEGNWIVPKRLFLAFTPPHALPEKLKSGKSHFFVTIPTLKNN